MGFTSPLGLLALLALPAILALHLYRRRLRERRVAGLFLFVPDVLASEAGRTRTRLLRTPSLWLELFAALLLALWLGGLVVVTPSAPEHLVVVLDDSASMTARGVQGTPSERAKAWVRARLDDMPDNAVVTLVTTGVRPAILAGPRAPKALALDALDDWDPARPAHDPGLAWALGLDLAGMKASCVWLTDHTTPPPPPRYRHVALGEALPNAAIVSARRVARGETERLFVDLLAWGEEVLEMRLEVTARGDAGSREVAARDVSLTPGSTLHLAWTLPASRLPLEVRLMGDALGIDDGSLLLPEPRRTLGVHVALPEETARALRLGKVLTVLPDVREVEDVALARLVVTDVAGIAAPGATELVVRAPGEERDDWIGPFLVERRRALAGRTGPALLQGVSLEGVIWSAGTGDLPGLPLVLAGDTPLLTEESRGGVTRLHLNLDPARSNLPSSPDWPIFLSNLAEQVRETLPGPLATNVRVGEEIAYRFAGSPEDASALVLVGPRGGRRPAKGWKLLTWEARAPGTWRLVDDSGSEVARFAASFVDPAESDLTQCGACNNAPSEARAVRATGAAGARGGPERRVLAVLLLLALAADVFVLGRRR